jgi:hypothetical protein
MNRYLCPLCYDSDRPQISVKSLRQTADHPKKPVCTFLPAFSVGEQTGGEKFTDLLSLRLPIVQLFSPRSRPDTIKIGQLSVGCRADRTRAQQLSHVRLTSPVTLVG